MIKELTGLYTFTKDNVVLCFGTTVRECVRKFEKIKPNTRKYQWYLKHIKHGNLIEFSLDGEMYYFQEVYKKKY